MAHVITLGIPVFDSMLSLAYSAPCGRLEKTFPSVVFAEDWSEIAEYQRLTDFLKRDATAEEIGERMLAQTRRKQIAHGPSIRFQIPKSVEAGEINGFMFRWGITFRSESPFPEHTRTTIEAFLKSFSIGEIESYSED